MTPTFPGHPSPLSLLAIIRRLGREIRKQVAFLLRAAKFFSGFSFHLISLYWYHTQGNTNDGPLGEPLVPPTHCRSFVLIRKRTKGLLLFFWRGQSLGSWVWGVRGSLGYHLLPTQFHPASTTATLQGRVSSCSSLQKRTAAFGFQKQKTVHPHTILAPPHSLTTTFSTH